MGAAYWLDKVGKTIFDGENSIHLKYVYDNPEKFGLSDQYLRKVWNKYDEGYGDYVGGASADEITDYLISQGYVRIRMYPSHLYIHVKKFDRVTKKIIVSWVKSTIKKNVTIKIHDNYMLSPRVSSSKNIDEFLYEGVSFKFLLGRIQ